MSTSARQTPEGDVVFTHTVRVPAGVSPEHFAAMLRKRLPGVLLEYMRRDAAMQADVLVPGATPPRGILHGGQP